MRIFQKTLHRASRIGFIGLVLACTFPAAPAHGALNTPEGLSLRRLEEYRASGVPDDEWPALLETFGREDQSAAVHSLVKGLKPFPAAKLVALLTHPKLATRSGALDLLEEAAGDTFNFDPFLDDPSSGANEQALARWKAWSTGATAALSTQPLSDEQFRTLALEIMSGNRERSDRALQRLDRFGLNAIAQIEAFLSQQPNLETAAKAAMKAAEYRVVILQSLPKQGSALARELCLGTVEAQSLALATLGKAGAGVLPVIADFLGSPNPLVRETAVDAAFEAGGKRATGLIVERLGTEQAESVLHAMLRGVGAHAGEGAQILALEAFIKHPSENVVVSALEALGASTQGDVSAMLTGALGDPRWRVRAAALEAIGKRKLGALADAVKQRLHDDDLFVRVTAVEAFQNLQDRNVKVFSPILCEEFKLQNDLKAPILRTFLSQGNKAPPELFEQLWSAPPEVILQCLEALEDRGDSAGARVVYAARFAGHPNRDVAASALRLLASKGKYTSLLLKALQSKDPVIVDAVLDVLVLPPDTIRPSTGPGAPVDAPKGNPLLDRLYKALGAAPAAPAASTPSIPSIPDIPAPPDDLKIALARFFREGSPQQRFRAAVVLASQGDVLAAQFLVTSFDTFNDLDRRLLAGPLSAVDNWRDGPFLELAHRLLRDKTDDVREGAIELWQKPQRLAGLLAELSRPDALLQPDDLLNDSLDRSAQSSECRGAIFNWAQALFGNPGALDSHKVLAIVLLARSGQQTLIEPFINSPNPWLRRAAFRALGPAAAQSHLDALLKDDSAWVRAVIPFLAAPHNNGWRHWFDDAHSVRDHEDLEREIFSSGPEYGAWAQKTGGQPTPEWTSALEKLSRDPSESVRFEAQFALLRLGNPIDPAGFGALLATQSEESEARTRVGNYLRYNYKRLGRAYGILVSLAVEIRETELGKMLKHFGLDKDAAFTSFSALAQLAPAQAGGAANAIAPADSAAPRQAPFRVIFFHKVGCRECQRVREMLDRHAPDFPRMLIEEHDIDDPQQALLSEALSARFQLKDTLHLASPAVFTQAGALVREEITFPKLGDLLRSNRTQAPEPDWAKTATAEIAGAATVVTQRYEALSFGVISLAGLLDGINPCAFATLIFLISYLQVARRTPREILAIGGAFILAVFLTYFAVGFGLAQVLSKIAGVQTAGRLLNQILAGFALVVATLSFRDAYLASRGRMGDMSIQLPGILKSQIHTVIRQGSRATRFVLAAFIVGVAISLLELACTGQVYLPTILYMLHSGHDNAVGHLLLYNLAFILPLILVFGLAWGGMRTQALLRFQSERTALVKVLTGGLFLLLGAFLLFGQLLR